MKLKLFIFWLASVSVFLNLTPVESHAGTIPNPEVEHSTLSKKRWTGVWDYTVSDVPPEYSNGALHISKSGREYLVEVALDFGKIPAESVILKSKVLYFEITVDGMVFEVTLTRDGNSMKGEAASVDGVFYMKGQKRP